jgi:hypothetical protein
VYAVEALRRQWHASGERLDSRLDGLTDDELFWAPVEAETWSVRRDDSAPSGWQIDYAWPVPDPPPLTTIAWRLVHLANGNWIYWEHAFGPGERMFPDLAVPGTAAEARAYWRASRVPVTDWLATARDADLDEVRPSHDGEARSAGELVLVLTDEQAHHGAEIGVLRDLYRARAVSSPAEASR